MCTPDDKEPNEKSTLIDPEDPIKNNRRGYDTASIDNDDSSSDDTEEGNLWKKYNVILEKHPLLVKSITAFFILGGGDLMAQCVEHIQGIAPFDSGIDWLRTSECELEAP